MGVIEKIMGLKKKGFTENEIVSDLEGQGITPDEIEESLDRARIKSAISEENNPDYDEEMEQSIMPPEENFPEATPQENANWNNMPPQPSRRSFSRELEEPFSAYPSPTPQKTYAPQQYAQEEYAPQEYGEEYEYSASENIDSIIEVSEQVFSEKIKTIQKQIEEIREFRTLIQPKIENISERLKKIETTIDALQIEILEKVGSYGTGIDSIKKEMSMMQDSFGKVTNALLDKSEEKQQKPKQTAQKEPETSMIKAKSEKKKKPK